MPETTTPETTTPETTTPETTTPEMTIPETTTPETTIPETTIPETTTPETTTPEIVTTISSPTTASDDTTNKQQTESSATVNPQNQASTTSNVNTVDIMEAEQEKSMSVIYGMSIGLCFIALVAIAILTVVCIYVAKAGSKKIRASLLNGEASDTIITNEIAESATHGDTKTDITIPNESDRQAENFEMPAYPTFKNEDVKTALDDGEETTIPDTKSYI